MNNNLAYRYFVTFSNGSSTGNTEIRLALPIRGMADITTIQNMIRESVPGAVLLSWQRFED
ncbi:hypothetical protein ACIA59_10725 [Micromonospora haikouensis]|uniref:hypothetical protein n=1 Tax=Micromonospora haikouensis TaxID=686309 RepID=UPI00378FBA8E